jgi:hypothetical protein
MAVAGKERNEKEVVGAQCCHCRATTFEFSPRSNLLSGLEWIPAALCTIAALFPIGSVECVVAGHGRAMSRLHSLR